MLSVREQVESTGAIGINVRKGLWAAMDALPFATVHGSRFRQHCTAGENERNHMFMWFL